MEETKKPAVASKAAAPKTTAVEKTVKDTVKKAESAAIPAAKTVKEETVKAAAKVKDETAKAKTAVKKAATSAAKKAAPKKAAVTAALSVQFSGKSYTTEELVAIAKDVWKYDLKQKVSDFKNVELYVKPEENLTYYVINGEYTGSFFI